LSTFVSSFISLLLLNTLVYAKTYTKKKSLTSALGKYARPFTHQKERKIINTFFTQKRINHDIYFSIFENIQASEIIQQAKEYLGNKYVWGATGENNTFDCSGLTKYVYEKNGIPLPRTSLLQSKYGLFIERDELQPGDLLFFNTSHDKNKYVNHVGIYMGDNMFLHASSAQKKVVISNFNATFYSKCFVVARRPIMQDIK